jgi:hypothetical protein
VVGDVVANLEVIGTDNDRHGLLDSEGIDWAGQFDSTADGFLEHRKGVGSVCVRLSLRGNPEAMSAVRVIFTILETFMFLADKEHVGAIFRAKEKNSRTDLSRYDQLTVCRTEDDALVKAGKSTALEFHDS